jgi:acetyl esterase/lipase
MPLRICPLPTLIIQGGSDHIVKPRFAREFQPGSKAAGNRVELLEIPWAEHAFDAVFSGSGNQMALQTIEKFLREVL